MSDQPSPEDRKTLGLLEYRLDRHGEQLREHAVRLRIVEEQHAEVQVLQREVVYLKDELKGGFARQGSEISSLRKAVVGAAISIAGSSLLLAVTVYLAFG